MAEVNGKQLLTASPAGLFQPRERGAVQSLGAPLVRKIKDSRVLVVGAGGIGCELLKNLVCCGFSTPFNATTEKSESRRSSAVDKSSRQAPEIVVVDLDTIDLSNLNRQFLFRKQHIKKPKALVAKETASQFNPSANITAHHASIFDDTYDVEFFESFDIVFNALDNLAARRHVNKMCMAADVPLIESGTTGFNGQVQAFRKGVTQCYDCNPKPAQRSFPICTIRSTPSQPIHCIVWAKSYLLPELFGTSEEDPADVAVTESDSAEEVAKLREEAQALKKLRDLVGKPEFAQSVFNKVFYDDIERLRSMSDMWKTRKAPESLKFDDLAELSAVVKQGQSLALQDQQAWTLLENISVFCYGLDALSKRVLDKEAVIEFDKDDKDTLDFVSAAANLRSHIFNIPLHSEWDIKQMAGNIIPAIATSNAMTASLCVFEAFKILRVLPVKSEADTAPLTDRSAANAHTGAKNTGPLGGAREVFLTSRNVDRVITSHPLTLRNAECPVCSPTYAKLTLSPDGSSTVKDLVDLLKLRFDYQDFSITVDGVGMVYDPDLEDNLEKLLTELGVVNGKNVFLTVVDDSDEPRVDLILSVTAAPQSPSDHDQALSILPQKVDLPQKPIKSKEPEEQNGTNGTVARGEEDVSVSDPTNAKRKREASVEVEDAVASKKMKHAGGATIVEDDGMILVED